MEFDANALISPGPSYFRLHMILYVCWKFKEELKQKLFWKCITYTEKTVKHIEVKTKWPPLWQTNIFKDNLLNREIWISIKHSLKFGPIGPIDKSSSLFQVMAWRRTSDKPLSGPMMAQFSDAYMLQWVDKICTRTPPGPWFNITMLPYQYRKSHCEDEAILRPSYLHSGIFPTGKTASLYWIGALVVF